MNTNNKSLLEAYMKNELKSQFNGPRVDLTDEEAAKYHPAKDIAFLERLDADAITDSERTELIDHLDKCVFCRQELERLCQCEALFATELPTRQPIAETPSDWENPALWKTLKEWSWVGGALLLAIGIALVFMLPSGNQSQVAYNNIRKMLNNDERNFSTQLTDTYRLDGTSTVKGFPVMDDHKRDVLAAWQQLVADYPDNINFRTEFGKYAIFVLNDTELARNELEIALEKSLTPSELKRVPELHLLLGIAAFREGNDALAQQHYQNALDLDPKNLDAKVNLAISYYRSGDQDKAMEIYRELRTEKIPVTLSNQIDSFLERE